MQKKLTLQKKLHHSESPKFLLAYYLQTLIQRLPGDP
jgi:hypothetical protein